MLNTTAFTKKRLIVLILLTALLMVAYWLFSHSRIDISITGTPPSGDTTYTIRNVKSGEVREVKTNSVHLTVIVARGNYEVVVSNNSGSYVTFEPETPRFLGIKKVDVVLKAEAERTFIGDEPKECFAYNGKLLASGYCGGSLSEYKIHRPATKDIPTYTDAVSGLVYAQNPTLLTLNDRLYAIARILKSGADIDSPNGNVFNYKLLRFNKDFKVDRQVDLSALNGSAAYTFKLSQGDGFIAYEPNLTKIYNFSTSGALIDQASTPKPEKQGLNLVNVSFISSKSYAILYKSPATEPGKKPVSELVLINNGTKKHIEMNDASYTDVRLCGTNKVCLLGGSTGMDVLDISSQSQKYVFSVPDVSAIESAPENKSLLVATKLGLMSLDVDDKNGYFVYTFGDYKFNDIQVSNSNYVLRLTNNKSRGVALLINPGSTQASSIDKKVAQLQKLSAISFVSIYNKYIYISANLGPLVYDSEENGFGYSSAAKKSAADSINQEIDRIGINRKQYVITSNAF